MLDVFGSLIDSHIFTLTNQTQTILYCSIIIKFNTIINLIQLT